MRLQYYSISMFETLKNSDRDYYSSDFKTRRNFSDEKTFARR